MNLYEILEVSENASEDTINKIYKIQAKKYHPDLQKSEEEKIQAEEKMKKINDAYAVLSNSEKRKEYDRELQIQRLKENDETREKILNEIKNKYNVNEQNAYYNSTINNENNNEEQLNQNYKYTKKDYIRDYNKRLKRMKLDLLKKNLITNLKVILIFLTIILFLWYFPPTHRIIINFYEENLVLQMIVDIIKKFIETLRK